ncbi:CbtA family protein [Bradyrhizobium sp. CB3481]|uniref:CbtA family protein n=1 Tax=Bradyrhizobium sp. CB3481 TaxID=3039158 RepID=UPI0024B2770D|nr:CbtA family protein [Bradyrhizobium sp. CB3481]WFU15408.1 CbtA family protein [Bradyrhizobium sp. CB3481]
MPVFRSIVFSAALAGLIVGVIISIAQFFGTVPLIQQSEVYERKAAATHSHASPANDQDKAHRQESEWEPEEGFQRNAFTVGANILTAIGFALLLTGIYAIRGRHVTWREGLLWGLAGFVVFTAAPGLGLPPELPGMPVADLTARQTWWIATAAATAGGLALLVLIPAAWSAVLGLALIALPHLIGAPVAPESHSAVPAALSHRFIVVVTLTSLLFWALLGVATSLAFERISRSRA